MSYLKFKSAYDKYPKTKVAGLAYSGYPALINELSHTLNTAKVVAWEMYPGVNKEEIHHQLIDQLGFDLVIDIETAVKTEAELNAMMARFLGDDRVFGYMSNFTIDEFYDAQKLGDLQKQINTCPGRVAVYGFGATQITHFDKLIYCDLTRWEIQLRFRSGMGNFHCTNFNEDLLKKYKRGYFIEWRTADRIKKKFFQKADYIIDSEIPQQPKMANGQDVLNGLKTISKQPFRLKPYFDEGVWGGQWMKEVCNLDRTKKNFAWCFDGVPEEDSLYLEFTGAKMELPAIDLVFFEPVNLLGEKVYGRFGTEFPIRFDFLDTMEGGNLSLQVHPLTEYIQDKFAMHYTQDESYYILDCKDDASVYLGVKTGVDKNELIASLEHSQATGERFPDEKFINHFPVKKHDHLLIPAGTIHCSGKNTMVLEISSTPYIFTFKLWDWGRLGLDGLPRPVHINHGKEVIQMDRNTEWVKANLIDQFSNVAPGVERTGLHIREPLETRRYTFDDIIEIDTDQSVNMNNLVEGEAAIIESLDGSFPSFTVHYAETFIIPESVKRYRIRPATTHATCKIIKAYVR